jgi:uncharacterized protein YcbX
MRVKSLHIYPVKGCRGIDLNEAAIERRGLAHDRRYMIVDATGRFITQREQPRLATIETAIDDNGALNLSTAGGGITVTPDTNAPRLPVTLWKQQIEGHAVSAEADAWLSDYLGMPVRLVWQGDLPRAASEKYAPGAPSSYADDFPLLVAVAESLDDLNARLVTPGAAPLPMNRFRPNIVVEGAAAWAEDGWRKITILGTGGGVTIDLPKPCTRCVVTTTDQHTGAKESPEPLATLKKFRFLRTPDLTGTVFAQNGVPLSTGRIKTGDSVHVAESQTPPEFVRVA